MIVYEVYDGKEYEKVFPTKSAALAAGKENNATVTRVSIGPIISRQVVCDLLNRENYVNRTWTIYQPERA